MAEYLAPGVYVEETSYRAKTIEGVSTSTAAFVGPTRFGPVRGEPELLTSFADFERIYGGLERLEFEGQLMHNYVAHAVRNFFEEGGRRLYVARVYDPLDGNPLSGCAKATISDFDTEPPEEGEEEENGSEGASGEDSPADEPSGEGSSEGDSSEEDSTAEDAPDGLVTIRARYPGAFGNGPVTFQFRLGPNILGEQPVDPADPTGAMTPALRGARNFDVVWVGKSDASPADEGTLYWLERFLDTSTGRYTFRLRTDNPGGGAADAKRVSDLKPGEDHVRVLTVDVTYAPGQGATELTWTDLALHPDHPASLVKQFAAEPPSRSIELYVPLVFETTLKNGADIAEVLLAQRSLAADSKEAVRKFLTDDAASDAARSFRILLTGGSDGKRPGFSAYEGDAGGSDGKKSGLRALEDIEDISMVAAPGSTFGYSGEYGTQADAITRLLISHAERMRYRIAVLDSPNGSLVSDIRDYRGKLDSTHAALYYPWIRILDPVTEEEINLPPSGFVTGIYARSDADHGVHKAPANEVVRSAIGLEIILNQGQQDVLNPAGVNCFRFFEGRGIRLWGARLISSDPEWKYVNLRRYFAYLERSIEKGTQWVVFMNNTPSLWDKVTRTVEDFLFNEWKSQRLMGSKPSEAYFVRCDRSTMTQNDIDNGRLICLVGVAPVRPAEFVIFRIGQWTADRSA